MDKSLLQQYAQSNGWNVPDYRAMNAGGPAHHPLFKSVVTVNETHYTSAEMWSSIKDAEQAAARAALKSLNIDRVPVAGVHKSVLQQHCQKQKLDLPVYQVESVPTGFRATVTIAGQSFVGLPAPKKREAQAMAAEAALEGLGWLNPLSSPALTVTPTSPITPLKRSSEDVPETAPPEKLQKIDGSDVEVRAPIEKLQKIDGSDLEVAVEPPEEGLVVGPSVDHT